MKKTKRLVSLVLSLAMILTVAFTLVACQYNCETSGHKPDANGVCTVCGYNTSASYKQGTYRTFTTSMPSNWNELTYQNNADTAILSYIGSSFFEYDYEFDEDLGGKFNEDGSINADAIVDGSFTTNYSAAVALEDVTDSVDAKWGYTDEQKAAGGYAWKITLRQDLKWDDGTAIDAYDFIYSMKEQLNPLFLNYRATTYYSNIRIKRAYEYFYSLTDFIYNLVSDLGYEKNEEALADGQVLYYDSVNLWGSNGAQKVTAVDETTGIPTLDYKDTCPQWLAYNDEQYYFDYGYFVKSVNAFIAELAETDAPFTGTVIKDDGTIDFAQYILLEESYNTNVIDVYNASVEEYNAQVKAENPDLTGDDLKALLKATESHVELLALGEAFFNGWLLNYYYGANNGWYYGYLEVGGAYEDFVSIKVENTDKESNWDNVGIYAPSQYEIVICMDSAIKALKDDGSLNYLAAYYLSSLPLVKEDLYESCKQAPVAGSTLWTTNYNSSLETTASWGPYKLESFQGGKSFSLVRNDNWYGYNLEQNKNQYNITKIECEYITEEETQWMKYFSGAVDGISIDADHLEYVDSKYMYVSYGSTAYGVQIYSNLPVLKENGRNNGILAIKDFRQALSLMFNRDEFNKTVYGTLPSSYGLIGEGYYSDIENGIVYRNTEQAKKVLLRTYGFTENDNGTWTDGQWTYANIDEAYDALDGYNPTQAKALLASAIEELTTNAEFYGYDSSKDIQLLFGSSAPSATTTQKQAFMQELVDDLTEGSVLEGKIKITYADYSSTWSDSFKDGSYDLAIIAGIGGNIFDPFNTIGAFVDPDDELKFATWWDTTTVDMTFTMPVIDDDVTYAGEGQTLTMSVANWYYCLNGIAGVMKQEYTYDWNTNVIPYEARLELLAKLEEVALGQYFQIQCSFDATMSLNGAKFSDISSEYNTFMGYGGIRYMIVNYTDAEWAQFVSSHNNDLSTEYKRSE